MRAMVVYASSSGNTKAVAEYIAGKTDGRAVSVADAKALTDADFEGYDTVIIGSRIHAGGLSKDAVEFADSHRDIISARKNAFYICCMFGGDKGQKQTDSASERLGIKKGTFFVKGKKLAETGTEIDSFLNGIGE